jgi:hypothetical protein
MDEGLREYMRLPFKGPFKLKKINRLESAILDGHRKQVIRGRTIQIAWIFKALSDRWRADTSEKL